MNFKSLKGNLLSAWFAVGTMTRDAAMGVMQGSSDQAALSDNKLLARFFSATGDKDIAAAFSRLNAVRSEWYRPQIR